MGNIKATKKYKTVKNDLLGHLERNGTVGEHFLSLIDDYMDLWETKIKLFADIEKYGVRIGEKKNDSVDVVVRLSAQMNKILNQLEIKASQSTGDEYEM